MPEDTKNFLVARLEEDRINTELWLEGRSRRRPSQKRNMEQGEFLGAFGRVLGHPDVVDLFRHGTLVRSSVGGSDQRHLIPQTRHFLCARDCQLE